jgi:hypothetical protein
MLAVSEDKTGEYISVRAGFLVDADFQRNTTEIFHSRADAHG